MRMLCLAGVIYLGMAGRAGAQAQSAADLLAAVRADAAAYDAKVPSVSCHESIVIDERKHDEVKRETRIEGILRVLRVPAAQPPLQESHEFITRNGTPVTNQRFGMAYWLTGGFANGLGHNLEQTEPCFDATAEKIDLGWKLELSRKAGSDSLATCREHSLPGLRRTLLLNNAGHVLHVERTLPPDVAKTRRDATFAAMDFAPVLLGTQTVWLPARLESHDVKDENRLEVRYSECRLFGGSITILPGDAKVPEP